ncbi:MAG: site-2 protease family protein [Chloroflexi bacterium]|nr:site-2 protease family protein [Chloroflexota bacterium]
MSISESLDTTQPSDIPPQKPSSVLSDGLPVPDESHKEKFRQIVEPHMAIEEDDLALAPAAKRTALVFRGKLLQPASEVYPLLSEKIEAQGYTLFLQRGAKKKDEVLIVEGQVLQRNIKTRWWFHLGLLLVTILTTLAAGATFVGYDLTSMRAAVGDWNTVTLREMYHGGRQFAFPLLLILGVHEMGHYVAARLHKVKVTLPFFIPLPLSGIVPLSLGTMGAVIFITSPFKNRKMLFDVGLAGPLAGLLVAIPLFITGLKTQPTIGIPLEWLQQLHIDRVSVPAFLQWMARTVYDEHQVSLIDRTVFFRHPQALAAWFGTLLTFLNLLPLGQFDGGHVAFALFGRRVAWPLAFSVAAICVMLGLMGYWSAWLIWPLFALLTGLRHPPPHDDITPLGWPRMILGGITIALFFSLIVITPFYSSITR